MLAIKRNLTCLPHARRHSEPGDAQRTELLCKGLQQHSAVPLLHVFLWCHNIQNLARDLADHTHESSANMLPTASAQVQAQAKSARGKLLSELSLIIEIASSNVRGIAFGQESLAKASVVNEFYAMLKHEN